jgi:hypothetical protein
MINPKGHLICMLAPPYSTRIANMPAMRMHEIAALERTACNVA